MGSGEQAWAAGVAPLVDRFGRRISYVRLSVTDRCDLRCRYCMPERMRFLPKGDMLSLDEIVTLADILITRGVRRIRLTGGEPLVRPGISDVIRRLGERIGMGLHELTLTTNATQLTRFATALREAGIRRINVSLDSRKPERFRHITRRGDLAQVLAGIDAAAQSGLAVKINMVALAGTNEDEIEDMLLWCDHMGFDLTLIETMPLGDVEEDRTDRFLPLDGIQCRLDERFGLVPILERTGGPARYYKVAGMQARLGMITPLTGNFCHSCNRIRITATGAVYGCLGQDQKLELRGALRSGGPVVVNALLDRLAAGKPKGHDFQITAARPAVGRHMSVTGG